MIKQRWRKCWLPTAVLLSWLVGAEAVNGQPVSELPVDWRLSWKDPGPELRPLQIVHGISLKTQQSEGVDQVAGGSQSTGLVRTGMQDYRDHGLGGVVCNVNFQGYITSMNLYNQIEAVLQFPLEQRKA